MSRGFTFGYRGSENLGTWPNSVPKKNRLSAYVIVAELFLTINLLFLRLLDFILLVQFSDGFNSIHMIGKNGLHLDITASNMP